MQHLEEGTIHAWLDGELPLAEREAAEAHVASCPRCAAAVAEARGFSAASSRILLSLDAVPGGVLPSVERSPNAVSRGDRARFVLLGGSRARAWMAAAAVLILGTATAIAIRTPRGEPIAKVAMQDARSANDATVPAATAPLERRDAPAAKLDSQPMIVAEAAPVGRNGIVMSGAGTAARAAKLGALNAAIEIPQMMSRRSTGVGADSVVTTMYSVHGTSVMLIERPPAREETRPAARAAVSDALMAKAQDSVAANSITWSDSTGRTRTLRGALSQTELQRVKAALFGATP